MIPESKILIKNIEKYFLRRYKWRYHILIVDNHLFNCYSFFLQAKRSGDKLVHSHDLLEIPHDQELYAIVMEDLKNYTALSIEFRDTHHLVHPGTDIVHDVDHGHYASTVYRPGKSSKNP